MKKNSIVSWYFLLSISIVTAQHSMFNRGPSYRSETWSANNTEPSVGALFCGSTHQGKLIAGLTASEVSSLVTYKGGNGAKYTKQKVASTGVTGLIAVLDAGTLEKGNGAVQYTITGTPREAGVAKFKIQIGGKSCVLQREVVILHNGFYYGTVRSKTDRVWLDRNLGAARVAKSVDDPMAFGHRFQWGRAADGHEVVNWTEKIDSIAVTLSLTTTVLAKTDTLGHSNFIVTNYAAPNDWRATKNDSLWQGVNGINNPCPSNFRVPTKKEWEAELRTWGKAPNYYKVFKNSVLKLTAGNNVAENGRLTQDPLQAWYWSSNVTNFHAFLLILRSGVLADGPTLIVGSNRSGGNAVRCIKDE